MTISNMKELYTWSNARIGQSFDTDGQYGAQCVDLISWLNQNVFNMGLNTSGDYAKNIYYNNLPSGWKKVAGNPNNDAESAKIWDSLPIGSIVWFTNSGAGHVAIKSGGWAWCLQQNYATDGWGGPITNQNISGWIESGGAGFLGAWVLSSDSSSENGSPSKENPKVNKKTNPNPKVDNFIQNLTDISQVKEALNKLIESFKDMFSNQLYNLDYNQTYSNSVLTATTQMNMLKVELNDNYLNELTKSFENLLKNNKDNATNSVKSPQNNSQIKIDDKEGTNEEKVILITKLCYNYCTNCNAFGVAGLIGNFVGESGLNPATFEADFTGLQKKNPTGKDKPTAENLYGSWSYFQNNVYAGYPLKESTYLFDGQHWLGCGLGQWTGQRTKALYDYATSKNVSMWTVSTQMRFAFEGDGTNSDILRKCLINSESVREGVDNAYTYWERASVPDSLPKRYAGGEQYYNLVKDTLDKLKTNKE